MEKNLEKWGEIQQFKSSYDDFVRNLKKLEELIPFSEKNHDDIISDLKKSRSEITTLLIPVSNLLDLYAIDKNKKSLKKTIDKTRRNLDKLSNARLSKKVTELTDYAEKTLKKEHNKENKDNKLESYGLSQKHINELKAENEKFIQLGEKLKTERKASSKAYKEIPKLIKENDKIIRNRLNKFMSIFKNTDPDFYSTYRLALKDIKPEKAVEKSKTPAREAKVNTKQVKKAPTQSKKTNRKAPAKKTATKTAKKTAAAATVKEVSTGEH